ncbi:MAG: Ku protein [Gemmatimonadota bacterium]|nr:Ku protein [Gemmatimonadota bacterium]
MAARAMWKAVLRLDDVQVPVKLYAGVEDRGVHFRLLHERDRVPVRQELVDPDTDDPVPREDVRKGVPLPDREAFAVLSEGDLEALEPEPSRDIDVQAFVPPDVLDHRWYDRPYYLGPDGAAADYAALVEALRASGREGVARWVMRKKEYRGALRVHEGALVLVSLRPASRVVAGGEVSVPQGRDLEPAELELAQRLIASLEGPFEPERWTDEHRERLLELIDAKASGKTIDIEPHRRTRAEGASLREALEASLASA